MKLITTTILICSFLLLSGCGSLYLSPKPDNETAIIHIKSNHGASGSFNLYTAYENDQCQNTSGYGNIKGFSWATDNEETIYANSNKRIYLVSSYTIMGYQGKTKDNKQVVARACFNQTSFIPENGHRYEVKQTPSLTDCKTSIIDISNGHIPNSVIHHPIPEACKE